MEINNYEEYITEDPEILQRQYLEKVRIRSVDEINRLFPNLNMEIVDSIWVKKTTSSRRVMRNRVSVLVGDGKNVVGLGVSTSKETKSAINKAIYLAKKNLIWVYKGCGSISCRCGRPHSILGKGTTRMSALKLTIYPAPIGSGLVCSKLGRIIAGFCGISDIYTSKKGKVRSKLNYVRVFLEGILQSMNYQNEQ